MIHNSVASSAPGKIMLLGEHAAVYGDPCLVSAIDRRVTVRIDQVDKDGIEYAVSDDRFLRGAIEVFSNEFSQKISKIHISTKSELKVSGLGSSAAVIVSCIKALAEFFNKKLTKRQLFELSYKTVLRVQKIASGFDVAASVFEGLIYYSGKGKIIKKLNVKPLLLVVAYTGIKADTTELIQKVAEKRKKDPKKVNQIFVEIESIVKRGKQALEKGNWKKFGKFLNKNHKLLQKLGVSSNKLDQLVATASDAGAYGAKLSGAGGGDCMIALHSVQGKPKIVKALEKAGGEIINLNI